MLYIFLRDWKYGECTKTKESQETTIQYVHCILCSSEINTICTIKSMGICGDSVRKDISMNTLAHFNVGLKLIRKNITLIKIPVSPILMEFLLPA